MFGTAKRLRRSKDITIAIGNEPLEKVQTYKYLGMWMDATLNWHHHIDKMRSKISQRLGVFKRVRSYLAEDLAKTLYNTMILPLFDYCDTIYGRTDKCSLQKLQRLQNRGGKIILRVPTDTSTASVLTQLKWIPLTKRVSFHTNILMYKTHHSIAPGYLSRQFSLVEHKYNTGYRIQIMLNFPKIKLDIIKRSFRFNGAKHWIELPLECKAVESLVIFKKLVLKYLSTLP